MSVQTEQACAACGKPLRPGARFCTACGTAVAASVVVVQAQPVAAGATPGQGRRAARGPAPAAAVPLGAAFDGVRAARVGQRLLAFLVDTVCVALVSGVVLALSGSAVLAALAAAELVIGIVVWEARTGRTFGNVNAEYTALPWLTFNAHEMRFDSSSRMRSSRAMGTTCCGAAGAGTTRSAGCEAARNRIDADMHPMRTVPQVHVWAMRSQAFSSSRTFPGHA